MPKKSFIRMRFRFDITGMDTIEVPEDEVEDVMNYIKWRITEHMRENEVEIRQEIKERDITLANIAENARLKIPEVHPPDRQYDISGLTVQVNPEFQWLDRSGRAKGRWKSTSARLDLRLPRRAGSRSFPGKKIRSIDKDQRGL